MSDKKYSKRQLTNNQGNNRPLLTVRTVLLISFLFVSTVAADTTMLYLKDGGTLEGELLNPSEISRKTYQIKTAEGLEITLDAKLIERVQNRERPAIIEYNTTAPLTENTIENHLYWTKWCNERQLPDQAKLHWQLILELDSDHADARRALGYERTRDGWISLQSKREDRGFVQYRGRWRTVYEIEVETMLETQKNAETEWRKTILNLCRRLPNVQAEAELLSIQDPAAYIPLRDALLIALREGNPLVRKVLLRTLARLPNVRAVQYVAGWSIRADEPFDDIRQMCVDELLRLSRENHEIRQMMMDTYRSSLRAKVEPVIPLVAKVLGDIEGYEAIPELIDALVITRVQTIQEQPQPYSMGPGGTTLGQGSRTIRNQIQIPQQAVLNTLVKLTGLNYLFDQSRWQEEYRKSQRSPAVNLRRI